MSAEADMELVLELLLEEIVSALLARKTLSHDDVAGAVLRTQYRGKLHEDVSDDDFIGRPSKYAEIVRETWSKRFGLQPHVFALEKRRDEWEQGGSDGNHPWEALEIHRRCDD